MRIFIYLLIMLFFLSATGQVHPKVFEKPPDEKDLYRLKIYNEPNWGGLLPYYTNGLWGFRKKGGQDVIEPQFDAIQMPGYYYAPMAKFIIVRQNEKWGLINILGQVMLNFIYDEMYFFSYSGVPNDFPEFVVANLNGKWGLISAKGKILIAHKYDSLGRRQVDAGNVKFKLNGKYGLVNFLDSKEVFPPVYDLIEGPYNQGYKVKKDNKTGIIDIRQKVIFPILFDDIDQRIEAFTAKVKINGKWGVADTTGNLLFPAQYDRITYYDPIKGIAWVMLNKMYGSVDKTGKEIIAIKYDYISGYKSHAMVRIGDKWGIVDTSGKELIPVKYDELYKVYRGDGSAFTFKPPTIAKLNGKWLYIDSTGTEATQAIYDDIKYYWFGKLSVVKKGNKFGFIDNAGKEVTPFNYDQIEFSSGFSHLFKCRVGNKWLIFDENSIKEVTPPIYDEIIFNNFVYNAGKFAVKQNDLWGFIDKTGKVVIKPKFVYDEINPFKESMAAVRIGEQWGYINKAGKIVVPIKYEEVTGQYIEGKTGVKLDGKWGLINKAGNIISPIQEENDIVYGEDDIY